MALILNIESSNSICSVCLAEDGKVTFQKETTEANRHSELLASFTDDILKEAKITTADLDAIAVSKGPGSYTGLRIGVSLAKGLAYAGQIPLIAVDTLKSIAWKAKAAINEPESIIRPMIDARRMEVYSSSFHSNLAQINEPEAIIVDETSFSKEFSSPVYFCGNGAEKCKEVLTNSNAFFIEADTSSLHLAELSYQQFLEKDFVDTAYFEPFYLKQFSTTVSKKKLL